MLKSNRKEIFAISQMAFNLSSFTIGEIAKILCVNTFTFTRKSLKISTSTFFGNRADPTFVNVL